MTIPSYRLPAGIERGAVGGPEFNNIKLIAVAGQEQRIRRWAECRARFDIAYGLLDSDDPTGDYQAILHLFYGHLGSLYPFRFKSWQDFEASSEQFGTGNGSETIFQLTKTYDPQQILLGSAGSFTYVRTIVLPIATSLVITVNATPTVAYTLGSGGIITFNSAPANGHIIRWTGEFDLPVRFDTDYLPIVMDVNDIAKINTIPVVEVISEF